jgi:protein-disulfide isomerase
VTAARPWLLSGAIGLVAGGLGGLAAAELHDRATDEQIVGAYLLNHPEIIPQAMERLQANSNAHAIAAARAQIEAPFAKAWAGNPHGDVTLVMFTDYACGYCRASAPDIDALLAADPKLKVVWREIPVLGPQSQVAARYALAAAKEGRYLPFHRTLFSGGRPDAHGLAEAARAAGLQPDSVARASAAPDITREVNGNLALATQLQINATPTFVVGNRMLTGAVGRDALASAIADARTDQ